MQGPNEGDHTGDAALYERLGDPCLGKAAYEALAISLIQYSHPILRSWLASGQIYSECRKKRRPVHPTEPELHHLALHPGEVADLVNDTLAEAIIFLRVRAMTEEDRWRSDGGASLKTYFVGTCVLTFQTVFRQWRSQRTHSTASYHETQNVPEPASNDNVENDCLTQVEMDDMPADIRKIVYYRISGLTFAEIAERIGAPSAAAVEQRLRRYRNRRRDGGRP